ncbi:ABC transporter substrate-binding protein [Fulvimarina endophytica]|uniref:ABC transporter substrate-binding protein n=1 Tax=Fulvimarina endophytica TaxID=2293836 RepID=UPI001AECE88C|nr:ABC transporter substrate-binding protein [Fulvimarina endophytica]
MTGGPPLGPTRRAALAGLAGLGGAALLGPGAFAAAAIGLQRKRGAGEAGRGFAVVDWALLETALILGLEPLAAPELVLYRRLAVEPPVPSAVADLGLRGSLSFERLALADPAIVFGSNFSAWAAPQIEAIAPFVTYDLFLAGEPPLSNIEAMTRDLGDRFAVRARADRQIEETGALLGACRDRLRAGPFRDVLLVDLGDAHHVRVYGSDSLFGDVLQRLGLPNTWEGGTRYSATAPVGMEVLAEFPEAFLLVVGPVPPDAGRAIETGALWQALPQVAAGRMAVLPPVNAFGALASARRLSRFVTAALLGERQNPEGATIRRSVRS